MKVIEPNQKIEPTSVLTGAFERLISLPIESAEANVESLLHEYLSHCCVEVIWVHRTTTSAGFEDLTSTQLNVVIECKKPGTITLKSERKTAQKVHSRQTFLQR